MTEERSPIDLATDLFVYAPIGLAIRLSKTLPELIDTGRSRAETPLNMARVVGKAFVDQQKHTPTGELFEDLRKTAETCIERGLRYRGNLIGLAGLFTKPETPTTSTAKSATATSTTARQAAARQKTSDNSSTKTRPKTGKAPKVESLAIPSYGSLSATQIVSQLRTLPRPDLEMIRAYEAATRARRTILTRLSELLSEK